ncbi:hypothetical protein Hanom_Chr16g01474261 [Helianthus anomalus]
MLVLIIPLVLIRHLSNGMESLVEASPLAKQVPEVATAFTVVHFANNIYGGMHFVDWARWSGVGCSNY